MNSKKRRVVLASIVGLSLIAAACGEDEGAQEPTTTPAAEQPTTTAGEGGGEEPTTTMADGGEMELAGGEVFVTGSSTVEPISVLVSELAGEMTGGQLAVTVEGPGTGDGFKKFCAGEADVTGGSRAIKDEEAATCAENGVEFVEIEVAIDGLTVATSPNNSAVECLDTAALYALIGPESEGFSNWSDANTIAGELGSAYADLPDAPLVITGPGPESGTYDTFVEFAIADHAEERGTEETTRVDYTQSPNDNLIVEGIEGNDTSLGWVGFAFYAAEAEKMKAIGIDTGDGCVVPTEETIADGSYGFSRSLYIYVNVQSAAENPAVASFVDLYLSDEGIAQVGEAGYVALPADRLEASRDAWASALS
ncbi:MAG TPA: phosphate-binding protein [Acidimicrobiaceae bacterium]|nr:phosphate-binding protein [Acidimicrobiaceae bacterium]